MPLLIRSLACSTSSKMPGTSVSVERVAINPNIQGISTRAWVSWVAMSGSPNIVKAAGAGSVCHSLSIAASFIFWCSVTV